MGQQSRPPGWKLPEEKVALVYHNLCLAHSAAQRAIKEVCGKETLTGRGAMREPAYPEKDTPGGREAAYRASFDLKVGWVSGFP